MTSSVLEHYNKLIETGELKPDPEQRAVIGKLDALQAALARYRPAVGNNGLMGKLFGKSKPVEPPRGLYIWGDVGRGKTMLMDLFHEHLDGKAKQRSHFLEFMQAVHADVHDIRRRQRAGELWEDTDPIQLAGEHIAGQAHVLCFDEFQVNDITDAMILGRLFEALFARGVVIVATSNVEPRQLYKDGLNRNAFMPFIDVLTARMDVVSLDSPTDYRLGRLTGRTVYHHPLGTAAAREVQQLWREITECERGEPDVLRVKGRELQVPQAARSAARFSFADLCEAALGAPDYIAISATYATVFIEDIPVLTPEMRNEAKRFITLIDALYDRRTKLVASAAAAPQDLYPKGPHQFEFDRTISRLKEMQSAGYWFGEDAG